MKAPCRGHLAPSVSFVVLMRSINSSDLRFTISACAACRSAPLVWRSTLTGGPGEHAVQLQSYAACPTASLRCRLRDGAGGRAETFFAWPVRAPRSVFYSRPLAQEAAAFPPAARWIHIPTTTACSTSSSPHRFTGTSSSESSLSSKSSLPHPSPPQTRSPRPPRPLPSPVFPALVLLHGLSDLKP